MSSYDHFKIMADVVVTESHVFCHINAVTPAAKSFPGKSLWKSSGADGPALQPASLKWFGRDFYYCTAGIETWNTWLEWVLRKHVFNWLLYTQIIHVSDWGAIRDSGPLTWSLESEKRDSGRHMYWGACLLFSWFLHRAKDLLGQSGSWHSDWCKQQSRLVPTRVQRLGDEGKRKVTVFVLGSYIMHKVGEGGTRRRWVQPAH